MRGIMLRPTLIDCDVLPGGCRACHARSMARLTAAQLRARDIELKRLEEAQAGNRYAVVHGIANAIRAYYPTLEAAEENRDRMIRQSEKPIPDDLHDRRGTLFYFWAYIEHDGVRVPESERRCVVGAEYPDEDRRRGRR
jgi:hypothetical protein